MSAEVEETVKRIQAQKGVVGVVITTFEGATIHSTMDEATTRKYAMMMTSLIESARNGIRELDNGNDLTFLRMRTKKHELMVAPDKNYLLIVVQSISTDQ